MAVTQIKRRYKSKLVDVIIPAAGAGRRMTSYGAKSLLDINGETILARQLRLLREHLNIGNIVVICGLGALQLMNTLDTSVISIENENYGSTNVVRSIGMGLRACSNNVLVVYGDLVFNSACLEHIKYNQSFVLTGPDIMQKQEVGCVVYNNHITNMMYDLPDKWGQIAFFRDHELKLLRQYCWTPSYYNMFGFEVINKIIEQRGQFAQYYHPDMCVMDVDTSRDLAKARAAF